MLNVKLHQIFRLQNHQNHQVSKSYADGQYILDKKNILQLPIVDIPKSSNLSSQTEALSEIMKSALTNKRSRRAESRNNITLNNKNVVQYLNFSNDKLPLISNPPLNQQNQEFFMKTQQKKTVIIKIPRPIKIKISHNETFFYYIGRGNNHELIDKLLKQRKGVWVEAPNSKNFVHFTWTQYGQNHDFKKHCQLDSHGQRQTFNQFEFHKELTTKIGTIIDFLIQKGLFKNLTRYFRNDLQKVFNVTPISFIVSLKRTSGRADIQNFLAFYLKHIPQQLKNKQVKPTIELKYLKRVKIPNQVNLFQENLDYSTVSITSQFTSESSYSWILKANDWNRGDGIHVWENLTKLETLLNQYYYGHQEQKLAILNQSGSGGEEKKSPNIINQACKHFIIQKYLENPFLINKRKFDIRIWVLLTHQMEYYVCKEGYIRTSSEIYELNNIDNPFIHLTNNAVQKYSENYGVRESGNQLSYEDFNNYLKYFEFQISLRKIGMQTRFRDDILPQIYSIINIAMTSVAYLINRNKRFYCYQIFGFDFLLDDNLQPWLIEVNTNPCLEESSNLLKELIPRMVNDAFKLTIDQILHLHSKNVFPLSPYKDDQNIWEKLGNY